MRGRCPSGWGSPPFLGTQTRSSSLGPRTTGRQAGAARATQTPGRQDRWQSQLRRGRAHTATRQLRGPRRLRTRLR
eukprot:7661494-Alexandrium_andersonii.AAC.1